MASIETRKNEAGVTTSHRVIWRDHGRRMAKSFKSQHQAEQWKAMLDIVDGDTSKASQAIIRARSRKPTFHEAALVHIDRLIDVAPSTRQRYRSYLTNHTATLNAAPVDTITEDDFHHWVRDRMDAGLAPKTIKNVCGLLAAVLSEQKDAGNVERMPVVWKMLPKVRQSKDNTTFLTMAEFNELMGYMHPHYHLLFRFLIATGLRLSEAAALTPEDFTLSAGTPVVRVSKAWKEERTPDGIAWTIGPPKTAMARRTVSIPPSVAVPLSEHIQSVERGALVFTMLRGSEVRATRLHNRVWQPGLRRAKEAGFRKSPRIHDLRHSHASLMLANGMPLYELSVRLGHESTDTTTSTYSHLMPDAHFRGADYAEKALTA